MFDERLAKAINSGRCFALIGSGPSCEMGYPSWKRLTEKLFEALKRQDLAEDPVVYERYIRTGKFPELFQLAEHDCGGRQALVEILKPILVAQPGQAGHIYDFLVRWPFACYLATNYDDELSDRLRRNQFIFEVRQNRMEDFY